MSFNNKPSGIWDLRPEGARDPNSIFPPVKCLVMNGVGERIPDVFFVNFDTGLVGKWKSRKNEFGIYVKDVTIEMVDGVEKRTIPEEWVTINGVHVIPFPPGYEQEMIERCTKAKAKFRADHAGCLMTQQEELAVVGGMVLQE